MLSDRSTNAYTGTKASYVALSAVTVLALALLCSIWTTDVSGSIALLGLFAVYMASQELLVLFMVFVPASILVDLMRGLGGPSGTSGRGWLIFLQLLELLAKVAGGVFAFSLWRTVSSGSSGEQLQSSGYAAPPPVSVPVPGTSSYQRVQDPFSETAAYLPARTSLPSMGPMAPGSVGGQYQEGQAQQQQQQQQMSPIQAAAPTPVAPHHDLV